MSSNKNGYVEKAVKLREADIQSMVDTINSHLSNTKFAPISPLVQQLIDLKDTGDNFTIYVEQCSNELKEKLEASLEGEEMSLKFVDGRVNILEAKLDSLEQRDKHINQYLKEIQEKLQSVADSYSNAVQNVKDNFKNSLKSKGVKWRGVARWSWRESRKLCVV